MSDEEILIAIPKINPNNFNNYVNNYYQEINEVNSEYVSNALISDSFYPYLIELMAEYANVYPAEADMSSFLNANLLLQDDFYKQQNGDRMYRPMLIQFIATAEWDIEISPDDGDYIKPQRSATVTDLIQIFVPAGWFWKVSLNNNKVNDIFLVQYPYDMLLRATLVDGGGVIEYANRYSYYEVISAIGWGSIASTINCETLLHFKPDVGSHVSLLTINGNDFTGDIVDNWFNMGLDWGFADIQVTFAED